MAISGTQELPRIHRLPQSKYVDSVRWLPPVSAFDRFAVFAFFNSDSESESASVEIHSVNTNPSPEFAPQSSWNAPSRISSLKTTCPSASSKPLIAASTFSGSFHVLTANLVDGAAIETVASVAAEAGFHVGPVAAVDWREGGAECVSVGEDGIVNLVSLGGAGGGLRFRKVFDGNGLVGYSAVRWASPSEFVTGGYGFSLQWWDQRKPGGAVSQFKGNWAQGKTSGIVHSVDIHPSRKHTCLAGGSSGTVFAWDLRWQQQPILLSGVGSGMGPTHTLSESEVWEVQCDVYTKSNISSSRILPLMICSEDGILAIVEEGEEPTELLAEPCAINSFDIDRQNPSDVICSLEWESVAIFTRT